jgi:hypothetical protein
VKEKRSAETLALAKLNALGDPQFDSNLSDAIIQKKEIPEEIALAVRVYVSASVCNQSE